MTKKWASLVMTLVLSGAAFAQIPVTPPGGGSAAPSGPAGGDLAGTYPNPTVGKATNTAVTTTAAAGFSVLDNEPASAVTTVPLKIITPNMLTGATTFMYVGRDPTTTRNAAYMAFKNAGGNGSVANQLQFSMSGSAPFLTMFGTGNLSIGNNVDSGFKLDVTGSLRASSAAFLGDASVTGNVNVQGNVSSTSNTSPAGPTNSGVALNATPNIADVQMFDSTRAVNDRTAEWIFFNGAAALRFANDAHSAVSVPFQVNGGQASGITGITSNSGTGLWSHTGSLNVTGTLSANGTGPAGTFPSVATTGVFLTTISNQWPTLFFIDPTRTANNRTVGWQFINGGFSAEMWSDTGSTPVIPLTFFGGQGSGITSISSNSGTGFWNHTGGMSATAGFQLPISTVANLPACIAGLAGVMRAVSDAAAPAYNSPLTGGGTGATASVPVFCNGTAWTAH